MKVLIIGSFVQIVHRLEEMLLDIDAVKAIYTAVSHKNAASLVDEKKPDVILLGISLPENKSIELLGEIRKVHPQLPVVALSISMNEYVYEQCKLLKVNHLLDTYQDFEKLTGIINEMSLIIQKDNNTGTLVKK